MLQQRTSLEYSQPDGTSPEIHSASEKFLRRTIKPRKVCADGVRFSSNTWRIISSTQDLRLAHQDKLKSSASVWSILIRPMSPALLADEPSYWKLCHMFVYPLSWPLASPCQARLKPPVCGSTRNKTCVASWRIILSLLHLLSAS